MSTIYSEAAEAGDPAEDGRAFRRCLGQFGTGVTIMTTGDQGSPAGLTANSFASLSIDPPLILWSIARTSRSFERFEKASHFAVNILSAAQVDVSQRFASSEADKFAGVAWQPGRLGSPVLNGAIAALECETDAVHDGGDHLILIGRVRHFARFARDPLLFAQGRYATAQDHPGIVSARGNIVDADIGGTALLTLLFYAHRAYSAGFDDSRRAVGLTTVLNRALFSICERPGLTLDDIVQRIYLEPVVAEDALEELLARGLISRDREGRFNLTAHGREVREDMVARVAQYEAKTLAPFAPADVANARKFLKAFIDQLGQTSRAERAGQPPPAAAANG